MSITEDVIARAMRFVNEGQPYTYGGKNQEMNRNSKTYVQETLYPRYNSGDDGGPKGSINTEGHYEHLLGDAQTKKGNFKRFMDAESSPYVLIDCSGLTKVAFGEANIPITDGAIYQKQEADANPKLTRIDPSQNPDAVKPGALLHKTGHVAVMGYNKQVIEAKNWQYGCVAGVTPLSSFTSAYNYTSETSSSDNGAESAPPTGRTTATAIGKGKIINVQSYLNIRPSADKTGDPIGKLYQDDEVEITGDYGDWYQINYEGTIGYIWKEYVRFTPNSGGPAKEIDNDHNGTEEEIGAQNVIGEATVVNIKSHLNVRAEASADSEKLGELSNGDVVKVIARENNWFKILYNDGVAYISGDYAEMNTPDTVGEEKKDDTKDDIKDELFRQEKPADPDKQKADLSQAQIQKAVEYNRNNCSEASWRNIQQMLGLPVTGEVDETSCIAVADWQATYGLTIDGQFGPASETKMAYLGYQNYLDAGVEKDTSKKSYSNELSWAMDEIDAKYDMIKEISEKTDLPPELVAAIWYRESSFDDTTYMHNGDPLGEPTVNEPKGIYFAEDQFVEAAIDALVTKSSWIQISLSAGSKDVAAMCTFAEAYNGFGYRHHGTQSAYAASGTTLYTGGMYVRDGEFDPDVKDDRPGVMLIITEMMKRHPR